VDRMTVVRILKGKEKISEMTVISQNNWDWKDMRFGWSCRNLIGVAINSILNFTIQLQAK
jgi:hypothetical protein